MLGASFGNRVAVSTVVDALTAVQPSLILTGYPLYGPNGKDNRVEHFQSLPAGVNVLCISGEKDEFLQLLVGSMNGKLHMHITQRTVPADQTSIVVLQIICSPNSGAQYRKVSAAQDRLWHFNYS